MMRAKLIACAMAVALVAAATGPASAAAEEVVFEVNGKALKAGAPLHGTSYNVKLLDQWGAYFCDGWIDGEVIENPGATIEIAESKFFSSMEGEEEPICDDLGAPPSAFSMTLTEPLTLHANEENEIEGTSLAILEWKGCEYEVTLHSHAYKGSDYLNMYGGGPQAYCLGGASFASDFTLTSEGEPVTVDVS